MNVSIIGTGYVGLVQGACFADTGNQVLCMDIDEKKIRNLKKGIIPIYEPGLEEVVRRNHQEGRIEFTTSLKDAVRQSRVIFLCLPTPPSEDGSADLTHVLSVAKEITKYVNGDKILVSKSTVPVGTVDRIKEMVRGTKKHKIEVASNPEFLKEGTALQDSLKPDRIVIGSRSKNVIETLRDLYEPFVRSGNPILVMEERSAEVTKYAANSILATKISFMNELANLCETVGADIESVRRGIGSDPRIGKQFIFPGVGYGGSCFPKDVKALVKTAEEHGHQMKILRAVDEVNEHQKSVLVRKLQVKFGARLKGKTISIWGLSFKPMTDDIREAPALVIIKELLALGVKVQVHDPVAQANVKAIFGSKIRYFNDYYDALEGSHALMIITEWNEFRRPDFQKMKSMMKTPIIFDGRNIYDPKEMKGKGFTYYGIGRS
ncbi:MAG: UDP-glucose/GDP-mannose dehydrogenase family protein [bacterium]